MAWQTFNKHNVPCWNCAWFLILIFNSNHTMHISILQLRTHFTFFTHAKKLLIRFSKKFCFKGLKYCKISDTGYLTRNNTVTNTQDPVQITRHPCDLQSCLLSSSFFKWIHKSWILINQQKKVHLARIYCLWFQNKALELNLSTDLKELLFDCPSDVELWWQQLNHSNLTVEYPLWFSDVHVVHVCLKRLWNTKLVNHNTLKSLSYFIKQPRNDPTTKILSFQLFQCAVYSQVAMQADSKVASTSAVWLITPVVYISWLISLHTRNTWLLPQRGRKWFLIP